jgi:hypothetical protein
MQVKIIKIKEGDGFTFTTEAVELDANGLSITPRGSGRVGYINADTSRFSLFQTVDLSEDNILAVSWSDEWD